MTSTPSRTRHSTTASAPFISRPISAWVNAAGGGGSFFMAGGVKGRRDNTNLSPRGKPPSRRLRWSGSPSSEGRGRRTPADWKVGRILRMSRSINHGSSGDDSPHLSNPRDRLIFWQQVGRAPRRATFQASAKQPRAERAADLEQ